MMTSLDRLRRRRVRIAGVMFAFATTVAVAVIAVGQVSAGSASVLVGSLDNQSILSMAMLVASLALVLGLCNTAARGFMVPLKIIGVLGAAVMVLATGLATLWSIDVSRTTLLEGGCDTGYTVVERNLLMGSRGTIYWQSGPVIASPVGRTSGNNAYQPFAAGDYTAVTTDSTLTIEYRPNQGGSGVKLSLPARVDRLSACGRAASRQDAPPHSSERSDPGDNLLPVPVPVDEEIRRLLNDSFAVTSGTPLDASGAPLEASAVTPAPISCVNGSGMQLHVEVAFRTDDNARSITQILGIWDAAGYRPDRALHEEVRYSVTDPVARMTIRDRTSIDGLIRMTITSACVSAP